jgi:hypothetical protein
LPSDFRYNAQLSNRSCTPVLFRRTCGYPERKIDSGGVISMAAAPAENDVVAAMLTNSYHSKNA